MESFEEYIGEEGEQGAGHLKIAHVFILSVLLAVNAILLVPETAVAGTYISCLFTANVL